MPSGTGLVLKNTLFLGIVQVSIYAAPIAVLPFLTRTLGTNDFGIYASGFALFSLLGVIGDYGFNSLGPYKLASEPRDLVTRSQTLSAVLRVKFWLALLLATVPPLLSVLVPSWRDQWLFFTFIGLSGVLNSLLPVWFFQGIQRTQAIAVATLCSRALFVAAVLLLVKGSDTLWLAAAGNAFSLTVALMLYFSLLIGTGIRPFQAPPNSCMKLLKEGLPFFVSRAAVVLYTSTLPVLLGAFGSNHQVAIYSIADQVYRGGQSAANPVAQAIYPHAVQRRRARGPILGALWIGVAALLVLVVFLIFGGQLVRWFAGPGYEASVPVLTVLLAALVFSAPSQLLGFPALGAIGRIEYANRSVYFGGILALVLIVSGLLLGTFSAFYAALCVLAIELLVFGLRVFWLSTSSHGTR